MGEKIRRLRLFVSVLLNLYVNLLLVFVDYLYRLLLADLMVAAFVLRLLFRADLRLLSSVFLLLRRSDRDLLRCFVRVLVRSMTYKPVVNGIPLPSSRSDRSRSRSKRDGNLFFSGGWGSYRTF